MATRQGEKTSFALACGLLSQFMKEKGNPLNLTIGVNEAYHRPTTMRLLPGAEVETELEMEQTGNAFVEMELFPQNSGFEASNQLEKKPAEKLPLTIFYDGKVLVFENYPAEKVADLMNFASKGNTTYLPPTTTSSSSSQILTTEQSTVPCNTTAPLPSAQIQAQKPIQTADLPIMRKASLQRFLAKRKDRLNARAPYQQHACANKNETVVPKKENIEELRLGLGPIVGNSLRA